MRCATLVRATDRARDSLLCYLAYCGNEFALKKPFLALALALFMITAFGTVAAKASTLSPFLGTNHGATRIAERTYAAQNTISDDGPNQTDGQGDDDNNGTGGGDDGQDDD